MEEWKFLDGDRGRYIRRGGTKKRSSESTSGYTPTTSTSHLPRPHPDLYEAAVNGHDNQLVALKIVEENSQDCLLLEFAALTALNGLACIPKVREFNYDQSLAFIALEYLGDEWVSLDKDIQARKPFGERLHGEEQFLLLRKTIELEIINIHARGVVHGDLKSNHIFIKKGINILDDDEKFSLDYSNIKIVDFGSSYLVGETSNWRGGSIGFSNPYHWNENHRDGLQFSELRAIDWYSLYAILYHVYTGECFPVASPAFRLFINRNVQLEVNEYYQQLEHGLHAKFGGEETLVDIIKCLCNPKDFEYPEKVRSASIHLNFNFDYSSSFSIFIVFILFIGQTIRSSKTVLESFTAALLYLFLYVLISFDFLSAQRKFHIGRVENLNTWLATFIILVGVFILNGLNLLFEPKLFPMTVLSTIIAIVIIVFSNPLISRDVDSKQTGLLLAGALSAISIPYRLLSILPIMAGIVWGLRTTNPKVNRVLTYIYVFFTSIFSWAILGAQGVRLYSNWPIISYSRDIPFLLLHMLVWGCFSEIAFRVTSGFRKNNSRKIFFGCLLLLVLMALAYQLFIN